MKSPVNSHNDWDPLEEVIVGSIRGGVVPRMDPSFYTFHGPFDEGDEHHIGPIPESIVEETEEDIDEFVKVLTSFGVNVRRPSFVDHSTMISTPYWENEGQFSLMPRDCLIVIGDEILETPMMCRSRQCETLGFKDLLIEYFKTGAKWAASPKPRLLDSGYDIPNKTALPELNNLEPIFDAANILRCGRDLFFNVNMSGNRLGLNWLQSHLGR